MFWNFQILQYLTKIKSFNNFWTGKNYKSPNGIQTLESWLKDSCLFVLRTMLDNNFGKENNYKVILDFFVYNNRNYESRCPIQPLLFLIPKNILITNHSYDFLNFDTVQFVNLSPFKYSAVHLNKFHCTTSTCYLIKNAVNKFV